MHTFLIVTPRVLRLGAETCRSFWCVCCILYHENIFIVVLVVIPYPCTQLIFLKLYTQTCILNSDFAHFTSRLCTCSHFFSTITYCRHSRPTLVQAESKAGINKAFIFFKLIYCVSFLLITD